ncbi:MAG: hypothetical protein ILP11_01845 [Alphaproteobacteria bacterium]|nr:hypothetical protein [Alphaproteobacteria bacterium]
MKKYLCIAFALLTACMPERQDNLILSMAQPSSINVLQQKTTEQVAQLLGEPTFVRREEPNQSWVYRGRDCVLFVFFDQDGIASYTEAKGNCPSS